MRRTGDHAGNGARAGRSLRGRRDPDPRSGRQAAHAAGQARADRGRKRADRRSHRRPLVRRSADRGGQRIARAGVPAAKGVGQRRGAGVDGNGLPARDAGGERRRPPVRGDGHTGQAGTSSGLAAGSDRIARRGARAVAGRRPLRRARRPVRDQGERAPGGTPDRRPRRPFRCGAATRSPRRDPGRPGGALRRTPAPGTAGRAAHARAARGRPPGRRPGRARGTSPRARRRARRRSLGRGAGGPPGRAARRDEPAGHGPNRHRAAYPRR